MSPDTLGSFNGAARRLAEHRDRLGAAAVMALAACHDLGDHYTLADVWLDVEHRMELLGVAEEIDAAECGLVAVGWHWLKADQLMPSIPAQALFP